MPLQETACTPKAKPKTTMAIDETHHIYIEDTRIHRYNRRTNLISLFCTRTAAHECVNYNCKNQSCMCVCLNDALHTVAFVLVVPSRSMFGW